MRAVLVVALAARILRKPLTITAVGVESSSNRSYRRALRLLSRLATATSVRDARSGATLEQSGFKSVLVAADPVLLEDSAPVAESGADAAISLRRDASDALIDALASALASTLQQGATVMLVPMDNRPDRDRSALERLRRRLEPGMRTIWSDENADWRSTAGQIGGAKLCVGMRLHFLYFAAIAGCKVVPIVSSDKTSAFTDEMNLSSASAADPASVAMAVEDARTPRDSSLEAARIRARSAVRQAIGG
jgi:polysaccharide pyruvyl transferase WcaK-like protein